MSADDLSACREIHETGQVVAASGDDIWVETRQKSACVHCSSREGCGVSLMEQIFGSRDNRLRLRNTLGAKVGETVVLGISESSLIVASLLAYVLPLVLMLLGAAALQGGGDVSALLGAASGLLAGLYPLRALGRGAMARHFVPRLVARQPENLATHIYSIGEK